MKNTSILKSLIYATKGLIYVILKERNLKIHLAALMLNCFLIIYLNVTKIDAMFILIISCIVICGEIFNTAIERICDFIHPNYHEKIGKIKDISAASVLISALFSIVIGLIIYMPYLSK